MKHNMSQINYFNFALGSNSGSHILALLNIHTGFSLIIISSEKHTS